mgnify:FL=1
MPIDSSKSHSEIVAELMQAYEETGKIGNIAPKDKQDALNIANAIAFKAKEDK